jgi:hypothetical protein
MTELNHSVAAASHQPVEDREVVTSRTFHAPRRSR